MAVYMVWRILDLKSEGLVQIAALTLNWLWLGRSLHLSEAEGFFMALLRENESAEFLIKIFKMLFKCEPKLLHWSLKWNLWDVVSKWSEIKSSMIQNYLVVSWCCENKTLFPMIVVYIHPIPHVRESAYFSAWLVMKYISVIFSPYWTI